MPFDRFLIAPITQGLRTDLRPWLIPDDAWSQLTNAYIFRGRLRKRFGGRLTGAGWTNIELAPLFSRLAVLLGQTDAGGNKAGTVPGFIFKIGQQFSIGTEVFTVHLANGAMYSTTGASVTHTYNTATGAYVFAGAAPLTAVYFYPAEPVMGITTFDVGGINEEETVAFDTQFAYFFLQAAPTIGFWVTFGTLVGGATIPEWHGSNAQFFWSDNWYSVTSSLVTLYVTNFNVSLGLGLLVDDPIWYFNQTNWFPLSYSPDLVNNNPENVQPLTVTSTTAGNNQIIANYVQTARIIVAFHDRLLLLNTIENNANGAIAYNPANHGTRIASGITPASYVTSTNTQFKNRVRFSALGDPTASQAWLEAGQTYNPGGTGVVFAAGGGFLDAATDDAIVGAEFIKDRLIVYFERSTWELAYTGNQILPFNWQKINTELGSESTFSIVPFDRQVLSIGNTGVHACNGSNVDRIDTNIPERIFQIADGTSFAARVFGIRDYYAEMIYWTFVTSDEASGEVFPNKVLVYNYVNGAWAFNDDCITAFGYLEQPNALLWNNTINTWESSSETWGSGAIAPFFRQTIAGNQQGYIFAVDVNATSNAPVMQITDITSDGVGGVNLKIIDHTLGQATGNSGDYIYISNCTGFTGLNGNIYPVRNIYGAGPGFALDTNNININPAPFSAGYTGGGQVTRVSNPQILSKEWNPYVNEGRNVYLARIDFAVARTSGGQVTVDYYPSSTNISMINDGTTTGMIMGTGVLETAPYNPIYFPLEQQQQKLWHPVYFQTTGQCIQIFISMSPIQLTNPLIAFSDFQLEGLILYTNKSAERLQ